MNGCLPDRVLWALSEGEGSATDRDHLANCRLCAARARHLASDVEVLATILRDPPPAAAVRAPVGTAGLRWAAAALVAMAVGLAWMRGTSMPGRMLPSQATELPALQAFSADVFADPDEAALAPAPLTDLEVMAAAVEETAPCEWQPGGCDDEESEEGDYQ
jgi:hypothetical protein